MYLSKVGLFILLGGGILILLTIALLALGGLDAIAQVWLAVFAVFAVFIAGYPIVNHVRQLDRTQLTTPIELVRGYWALKIFSILLKLYSLLLLLLFLMQLFQIIEIRNVGTGTPGSLTEGVDIGAILAPDNLIMGYIIRSIGEIVGFYAAGQLIDAFLSIEQSLKTLATRRRPQNNEPS